MNDKKVNAATKSRSKGKKKSKESKTSPRRLRAAKKQVAALEMRVGGFSFRHIALELKYKGPSGAHKAVDAALDRTIREPAEAVRLLELERLDQLQIMAYKRATVAGDVPAAALVLKIMERRAKLLGIDAPVVYDLEDIKEIARTVHAAIERRVKDPAERENLFYDLKWTGEENGRQQN